MRYLLTFENMRYADICTRNSDVFNAKFKTVFRIFRAFLLGFLALFRGVFFCRFLRFGRFFRVFGFTFCF